MLRSLENIPLDHPLETNLNVLGSKHSITSLREPFMNTEFMGMLNINPPRFSGDLWSDEAKFREKFGPDVNPLKHGPYQARTIAIPAVDLQQQASISGGYSGLSDPVANYFVAYHVVHDDHEGITGDVLLPDKTQAICDEEFEVWQKLMKNVYGTNTAAGLIYYGGIFDHGNKDHFLPKLWQVSEKLGYIATGLRAYELWQEDDELTPVERQKSLAMAMRVVARNLPDVLEARGEIAIADDWVPKILPVANKLKELKA
ncbi:MAG: hypothetical protein M3Q79_00330 [bacterium]|nr:hypothetical protein [bacterium]